MEDFNLRDLTQAELKKYQSVLIEEMKILNGEIMQETDLFNRTTKAKQTSEKWKTIKEIEKILTERKQKQ